MQHVLSGSGKVSGELEMSEAQVTKSPRRADAQRNYDTILRVARAAVAERGANIVLEDIARDARVGIGTLYRHFPTRHDLLEAAFLDEALELRDRAMDLATSESAFDALVSWLRYQMDFGAHGRAMGAAVINAKHTEGSEIQLACVSMREAGEVLLRRAQASGGVRPEIDLIDLLRLMGGIVMANENSPDPERVGRMFDVVIAGIKI
jgi:AcrR family transcriptional regulator